MANKNLFKKVAPVILSATVAFSGMPATAFAADFADTEVATEITAAEEEENTEDVDVDAVDEDAEADVDVEEAVEEDTDEDAADVEEEASEDELFSAGNEGVDVGDGESEELTGEYQYVYAGLTWAEYWASEDVQAAGDTTPSSELDQRSEADKGAFDTVTRATTNHGPYRASFQAKTDIVAADGTRYSMDHWEAGGKTVVFTDGTTAGFTKKSGETPAKLTFADETVVNIDRFEMTGLKYVPVAVKTSDFEDFCKKYTVIKDGEKFSYGSDQEKAVVPHSDLVANVNADTNGLKVATKSGDGFTFSARKTGKDSGLENSALKTANNITVTPHAADGTYGEFLRVDLTGDGYGDLGGAMQAVKWEYYGNDDTYSNKIATYGTKFAADNWMHSSMGIQLGLTHSLRCQLPENYDGTGFWKVTIYALGYQDYTFTFEATYANIVGENDPATLDTSAMKEAIAKADALNKDEYTAASWATMEGEKEECQDMLNTIAAAIEAGKKVSLSNVSLKEQLGHLTSAMEELVKIKIAVTPATADLTVGGTTKLAVDTNIAGNVAWTSSDEKVATVATDGTVTAKAAGTATITATVQGKSATCTVTVKAAEQKPATPTQPTQPTQTPAPVVKAGITANVAQVYVGKKATIKVTKTQVTGTAKFTSSNKKVATVNSKGVITGKKAGKTVITVKVGKYTKKLTVTVKKPSFKLVKSSANLKKGKKVTIASKAAPAAKVTYKTSNKKVATVNSKGVVTAKKKGTAKITVKCNGITKTFKVTVK